ncbi:MAG: glycosyltransferase family 39 protein [Chloroflexi bacterium]|nr:glycosyltransferase family 39 protein [Chloroflexota bacterium]
MTDPAAALAPATEDVLAESREGGLAVSVESLAWAALLALAAALRLAALTASSFGLGEAGRALDAARVAGGAVPDGWSGDLAAALTSYLFRVFGESELVARLVPAVAGAALVGVLWLARLWLGRGGALVAAVLVAFSPLFVLFSRSALAFSGGGLVAGVMAVALFAYLRQPRPWPAFALVAALGLAPLTDAVAVTGAIAILAFVALEGSVLGNEDIALAWRAFRRSPVQWLSALLVLAAALELGLTHFGTSLDRSGLPGLRLWTDMFDLPRDSRPPEYHMALLTAYEWPVLLAGGTAFALFAWRLLRGGAGALSPVQRFSLLWTAVAALTLALVTRREAGQLLILLLPLALLAGALAEEVAAGIDWSVLRRWWPLVAACLGLIAYAALLLTEGSRTGINDGDRALLVVALVGAAVLIGGSYLLLRRRATALPVAIVVLLALPFLAHSSLAVARGDGAEFATDLRITGRAERFADTVSQLAQERGGTVVLDRQVGEALLWPLRDSPVVLGDPTASASAVIARADQTPAGFEPLGDPWRLAEGWYPQALLHPLSMWRWKVFRDPYGSVDSIDVRFYVPKP